MSDLTDAQRMCRACQSIHKQRPVDLSVPAEKRECFQERRWHNRYRLRANNPNTEIVLSCGGFSHINGGSIKIG